MREARKQFVGTVLLIVAVAAVIAAFLSFRHLRSFPLPDDGVTWIDQARPSSLPQKTLVAVIAAYIVPEGPGDRAGIHVGDELLKIDQFAIHNALQVPQALAPISLPGKTTYTLRRHGIEFIKDNIFVQTAARDSAVYYQYLVGAAYLLIGFFVYYRRTSATKSLHFFILCLASFIASTFHYSGKLNTFDEFLYWGNITGALLAPAIFLHFCLTFHEVPAWLQRRGAWLILYLPSCFLFLSLVASAEGVLHFQTALLEVRWLFDRLTLAFEMVLYLLGAGALTWEFARSQDPILRRQLKYLRNGALVGLLPFALLYAIPYILGSFPNHIMNLSVLSMALIPITWTYAITRYRLMDVDIIFQQGYVYTLATLAVIGTFYALIFLIFNTSTITPPAFVVLISFATFVFQPIRRWIQELLDRWVFYRDRYDARLTLIEFARELSSETDQGAMLGKVSDRLLRTLSIQHIGFFLWNDASSEFQLHSRSQKPGRTAKLLTNALDLSFLTAEDGRDYLFFERTRHVRDIVFRDLPQPVRDTIAELDFTYYVACRTRGRTIAYLGISRTTEGDFLSKDDMELLATMSNYVAIAIENSRLYSSLQRKADEYERLKEFSENIVESISVGILAVDLEDRVESWNNQIERLTGIARADAVGQRLADLFPVELYQRFQELRGEQGIHHVYKLSLFPRGAPAGTPNSVVNLAIAPLVSKDLTQIGRLIIFDDITDRDDLERRLMQADKLSSIGLLAAGVAHEVNTPLAVISTYAQMLSKQVSGDDQKSKLLDKIAKQTFRASEIVNSLLNFSRTSTIDFIELDLNRLLRETANLVEHQFQTSGVAMQLDLEQNLPLIRGNAGKLQQVFLNLFLNARDAMGSGGALAIRTWSDVALTHVVLTDTGQGIAAEHLARIYDPFFTTKGAKKGTGLGLSITYGIVQEHKGVIEVESSPGQGTTFRLEFPVAANQREPKAEASHAALPA